MRSYLPLLRLPGALAFCAAAAVGRMPQSMMGIGSILLVEDRRGSYAVAGVVAAGYAAGSAATAPLVSRLIDRRGQSAVLPWALAACVLGLVAMVLTAGSSLPVAVVALSAAVAGGALPPLGSCVRARWTSTLRRSGQPDLLGTAFALESLVDEVIFVLGPALVVSLAVAVDPAAVQLLAGALTTVGTVAFVRQRATEPPLEPVGPRGASAVRVPGLRTVAVAMVFVGLLFGSLELGVLGFADEIDRPGTAGVVLAVFSLASGVSALLYGSRTWTAPLDRRFLLAVGGLAVSLVPVALAPTALLLTAAAAVAGLFISPTLIAAFGLVERLVPPAARTEGFTWLGTGLAVGGAVGALSAGPLVDGPGARAALALAVASAAVAAGCALLARRTLVVDTDPVPA